MKRVLSFVIAMLFMISLYAASLADGESQGSKAGNWPEMTIDWADATLRDSGNESMRHQAYHGPGQQYASAGAFKPRKVKNARSLFRDGDYALVELDYPTVGKRCVYFKVSVLKNAPEKTMPQQSYPARTNAGIIPVMGPGEDYDRFTQKGPPEWVFRHEDYSEEWWEYMNAEYGDDPDMIELIALVEKYGGSGEIADALRERVYTVVLTPGTEVSVFFETDGWVYAEFTCGTGLVRAWLPAGYVTAE